MKKYLQNWYLPILIPTILLIIGFFILGLFTKISYEISIWLFYISFVLFLVSIVLGIVKIFKKDYLKGILQTIISIGILIKGFGYISFFMLFYSNDFFADDLELPKNIHLNVPVDSIKQNHNFQNLEFQLYNGFQPGIYRYSISLNKIDSGKVYLKAYEITKNTQLSEKELNRKSNLKVGNNSDSIKTFKQNNEDFTIYEGDWGQFYGARFEVWYKDKNGTERKLTEKNYKIEGWQR